MINIFFVPAAVARQQCHLRTRLRKMMGGGTINIRAPCKLILWPVTRVVAPCARAILFVLDNAVRLLGPCLIALAFILVTFFTLEILYIRGSDFFILPWGPVWFVMGVYLLINVIVSYYHVVTTGPGNPPIAFGAQQHDIYRICRRCIPGRLRMPRVHHCSACQQCIKRLDHHCPWVNGCIGEENYHYFLVFLMWGVFGSAYTCSALLRPFWLAIIKESESNYGDEFTDRAKDGLTLGFALSAALTVALSLLSCLHIFLVYSNRTTLEFHLQLEVDERLPTIRQTLAKTGVFGWPRLLWAGRAGKLVGLSPCSSGGAFAQGTQEHSVELADNPV
eukprot:Gregarina_sp_Poly_1__383@NODE_1095_length_5109_cov_377_047997_g759_i0_p3_GENE_NODE_1095_length_5109_cov_377_047997_g759_i0NODE_1095_length_5109_cov_377_047997_g759_i0_p3_ORF_typecomplete_len334_score9_27DHHC/PF01529_20/1_8e03DHHC/PF01529_20/5_5e32_NODE_1095_length_5109_cov_377_047997_g759_i014092410